MYWTSGNVMSIQKYDKLYLSSSLSNNNVYEFDLATEKKIKIVGSSEMMTSFDDNIKVIYKFLKLFENMIFYKLKLIFYFYFKSLKKILGFPVMRNLFV